ncbi:MAG: DUF421 domain-containing protein [Bacteroidetes bacterium]|nr:DUF421 domain-containing protein [Bacteroidota bacterium]MBK8364882.1 DUF421 domain-containing protein [Bacteroidota bacterium]MBK9414255.1 DUF421 domain-containing protein [Bacteroidota bacterium]MBP6426257.1 DUF421 domain-containing protein [Bacteroidia bacterium]MBP6657123.1 DUF421 domain-containing protein [Bacteroidia bacterium]
MDPISLLEIAGRSVAVYVAIILGIKIFGKKELSQLSVIDLVFILLISNSVQNAMVGSNTSLAGGVTAAASLFIVNYILKQFLFREKKVSQWIQGSPVILIHEGKIVEEHLKNERITHDELDAAIREHGVSSMEEVNLAILEVDGTISILSDNYKMHSKRKRKPRKQFLK